MIPRWKRVAVTGVTGTFGRAFVLYARDYMPWVTRLVGVSRDELKQSELASEHASYGALRLFLGDVRDKERLRDAFYHCDVVIHAAALKRVDAVSYNPSEVHKTNVVGTDNVIRAALDVGVARVLVISSDKAVAPTNIYGASKAMAEHIAVQANAYTYPQGTRVAVLRYGNVVGSRGSVIQAWRQQVSAEQPITITDRRMSRFMLTIDQAVRLAEACVDQMIGGEIFIPKLPTARMTDVAAAIGGPDYPTVETGLRPGGEKLAESLLSEEEVTRTVDIGMFYAVKPHAPSWAHEFHQGDPVGVDFKYVSDGSAGLMSIDEIRHLMSEARV